MADEAVGADNFTSTGGGAVPEDAVAFQRAMQRRIEEEVNKRRAQGKYPPSFEAKLRTIYEQLVPKGSGASTEDLQHLIYTVDRSAIIDIDVPLQSQKPGVTYLKTFLRKLMAWYLNYLAQQLSNFHANLIQLLHAYDLRLTKLERKTRESLPELPRIFVELDQGQLTKVSSYLTERSVSGRVLVTSCASNELLLSLQREGFNVYGIDAQAANLDEVASKGADARWDQTLRHLHHVRQGALSGLVVQGAEELMTSEDKIELLALAHQGLHEGGVIGIVAHDPGVVTRADGQAIAVDLAPGHYFQPTTWTYLLEKAGFGGVETIPLLKGAAKKASLHLVIASKATESPRS